jgi:hypothetical protein
VLHSTDSVAKAVSEATGVSLNVRHFSKELEGVIPPVDHLTPATKALGEFTIAVYRDAHPRRGSPSLWTELVDETGRRPGGGYYMLESFYGDNVRLAWYPDTGRVETDERWEKLDAELETLE